MGFWRGVGRWFGVPTRAEFSGQVPQLVDVKYFHKLWNNDERVNRSEAMSVPAVLRGRNMICSIATLPLASYDGDFRPVDNDLLEQFDNDVPNVAHLAITVEDLLCEAISWWEVKERDALGFPAKVRHLNYASVSMQPPGNGRQPSPLPGGYDPRDASIWVDGRQVSARNVIRFDSPNPPLLTAGARSIRRALLLDQAAAMYANEPRMDGFFTPDAGADPADDTAIEKMLGDFARARKEHRNGYIPAALKWNGVDIMSPADLQLVELQQRVSLDLANAIGVDPEDLGVSTTSRTYQNDTNRRQDRVNDTLAGYMRAITDRLGMRDVTRRGEKVGWDLDDYLKADPKTRAEVEDIRIANGTLTREEAREGNQMPPLPAGAARQLATVTPLRPAVAATAEPSQAAQFAGDDIASFTFDATPATFAVDVEARTITGLVVPWGKTAVSRGKRWRFAPGSIEFADLSRIKLLREHNWSLALGKAIEWTETARGIEGKFRVAHGEDGDRALALAADGVLDGLSINVDPIHEAIPDPENPGAWLVLRATGREVSLTPRPAFDDSRLTSVVASREEENQMTDAPEQTAPAAPAAPESTTDQAVQFAAFQAWQTQQGGPTKPPAAEPGPTFVDPIRPTPTTEVTEALPYRFSYQGGRHVFAADAEHDFSADLFAIMHGQKNGTDFSAPLGRVNGMISAAFADVENADVTALNPNRHRPEMWQPQMDYATPLWDMVGSGSTDGTKFDIPKFTSSSALVGPATEKTEPAGGAMVVELQTITPTQVWGKVEITRQAWRAGGTPQLSGILWDQMLREYYEDREAAVATFLNTLTAATDIAITGTPASTPDNDDDQVSANDLEMAIAALQFARGGNRFRAFAAHIDLYKVLARVKDDAGRPLYPMLSPSNANGTAANLFGTLNVAGTTVVPSWALGATGTAAANSWLFDPAKVRGWASAPERLFWDFGATVQTANIPQLSFVTLGIYGDVAFGNTDIAGVRQVIFDPSV